jgi:hypothetical protein
VRYNGPLYSSITGKLTVQMGDLEVRHTIQLFRAPGCDHQGFHPQRKDSPVMNQLNAALRTSVATRALIIVEMLKLNFSELSTSLSSLESKLNDVVSSGGTRRLNVFSDMLDDVRSRVVVLW